MKNQILSYFTVATVLMGGGTSCQNDDMTGIPIDGETEQLESSSFSIAERDERPTILGKQKENPFSVDNMQIALDSLKAYANEENSAIYLKSAEEVEVYPTDLYVRFLPKDSAEYNTLTSDTTLALFDIPLDYEIVQLGEYYQDSTVIGDYTWLYTTVKPDYSFPENIEHELLSELFIIENSEDYTEEIIEDTTVVLKSASGRGLITQDICNALYAISFTLTGNENELNSCEEEELQTKATYRNCWRRCIGRRWWRICWTTCDTYYYPDGKISLQTPNGDVGLKGVKVRMWRWFQYTDAYTNSSGRYYSRAKFNKLWIGNDIRYKIIYDCKRGSNSWKFKKSIAGAAVLWRDSYGMGRHSPDGHDMTFYTNSAYWGRGVLNNAIYDYIGYASREGIALPPRSLDIADKNDDDFTSSAPLLKRHFNWSLVYSDKQVLGAIGTVFGYSIFGWAMPDLILRYNQTLSDYNKITSVAWHELTHASQLQRMKSEKGFFWASDYWSRNVYQQARNEIADGSPYGEVGDDAWQIIALSEGWANYREEYLVRTYLLGTESYVGTIRPFLTPYLSMFRELEAVGCSFTNMEKALCTYSVSGYRDILISRHPSLRTQITDIISTRL